MNLISNSLDALSAEGEQWILVSDRLVPADAAGVRSMLEVSVTDSGFGLHSDICKKLFDEEISTKDAASGMGLGLLFCKNLIQRNGGLISLDKDSLHTRFYFQLPLADSVQYPNVSAQDAKAA